MDEDLNAWLGPVMQSGALPFQRDPRAMLIEKLMYEQMLNPDSTLPRDRMDVLPAHPYYSEPGTPMSEQGHDSGQGLAADPNFAQEYRRNDYLGEQQTKPSPEDIQSFIARQLGGI
jgi:hypothetical protein